MRGYHGVASREPKFCCVPRTRRLGPENSFSRRFIKTVATAMAVLYGCMIGCSGLSASRTFTSEQLQSLSEVRSITLRASNVHVVRQGITPQGLYERAISEWSEEARQNIAQAAAQQFGRLFTVRETDPNQPTDADLVVIAADEIKTSGRRGMDVLGFAYGTFLMPMLYVTVVPMILAMNPKAEVGEFNRHMLKAMWPAGLTTIKIELTDRRSGNALWSFNKESRSGYDLRDRASVEGLIAEAVEDLAKILSSPRP